jgi:hypothetical protein
MGPSPVQVVLAKCLKGFTVSERNAQSEQAREPNLRHVQHLDYVQLARYTRAVCKIRALTLLLPSRNFVEVR